MFALPVRREGSMSKILRFFSRRSPSGCTMGRCRSSSRCSSRPLTCFARSPWAPAGRRVEISNRAQAAIDSLQQIIRDLMGDASQPQPLRPGSTSSASSSKRAAVSNASSRSFPAHVDFEPGVGEIVFRTLRELLTNVRKHSQATVVKLSSRLRSDDIAITVADNGIGLQSLAQLKHPFEGGGFGLWSIEHRLGELGGSLEIVNDSGCARPSWCRASSCLGLDQRAADVAGAPASVSLRVTRSWTHCALHQSIGVIALPASSIVK